MKGIKYTCSPEVRPPEGHVLSGCPGGYTFSAKVYQYSTSPDMSGWTIVSLPKALSIEIRDNFKWLEEGWGRMKVTARVGDSEWKTSIWFDTKQDTYLLPLNAKIRKKEKIEPNQDVEIVIMV